VTLFGKVDSYAAKIAAQEAALRVSGVLNVLNDLQVTVIPSSQKEDKEIEQTVRRLFEWDVRIPHQHITTTVADGWVTLEGKVESLIEREDTEHAMRYVTGVRGVINNLQVVPQEASASEISDAIREALARSSVSFPERIQVTVADGSITLYGQVSSWTDKLAVLSAVSHTPGVRSVYDQLRIDPYS
jgi:osmotically-inducible protein OsmY